MKVETTGFAEGGDTTKTMQECVLYEIVDNGYDNFIVYKPYRDADVLICLSDPSYTWTITKEGPNFALRRLPKGAKVTITQE